MKRHGPDYELAQRLEIKKRVRRIQRVKLDREALLNPRGGWSCALCVRIRRTIARMFRRREGTL